MPKYARGLRKHCPTLSLAQVAGLQRDLALTDLQYAIAITVTYVPYIAGASSVCTLGTQLILEQASCRRECLTA
jgi:hypothetical protein